MNMKKTIAAVAAGAVAVSAMATTVSALEAKTLTYNLVKTVKNQDAAGTVTATFTNVPLEAGGQLIVEPVNANGAGSWNTVVTISGSFWDDTAGTNKSFVPVVATGRDWETGYSVEGSRLWDGSLVKVPVVAGTAAGTEVALKASSSAVITVTMKAYNLPDSVNYVGAVNGLIKDGKLGIKIQSMAAGQNAGKNSLVKYTSGGRVDVFDYLDTDTQTKVNTAVGADGFDAEFVGGKWVKAGVAPTLKATGAKVAATAGIVAADVDMTKLTYPGTYSNEQGNNDFVLTWDGTNWADQWGTSWGTTDEVFTAQLATAVAGVAADDTITINGTGGVNQGTAAITAAGTVADILNITPGAGDKLSAPGYNGGAAGTAIYTSPLSGAATEQSGNSEKKIPYRSTLRNSIYNTTMVGGSLVSNDLTSGNAGSGDVLAWIGYANSDSSENKYNSTSVQIADAARSVINDAVQNYSDVIFTFNTATSNVKIKRDNTGAIIDYEYTSDNTKDRTWDKDNNRSEEIVNYTAFGRHFWDRDTGYDANTIYITNDWLGNNLFEGALVINNNITLSLGATDKFDWTATSLSFSWDAIQDASLTQNQYANYIQNMILRTSTDWFWDNMTVTLGETETEEVDSGAPVEADDTDLPEEDAEEDLGDIDEEEEEEEPVEDVEPEPEPEPEPAPVETATNPGTGNASVALAVIPVALAAAAIVAKKRG